MGSTFPIAIRNGTSSLGVIFFVVSECYQTKQDNTIDRVIQIQNLYDRFQCIKIILFNDLEYFFQVFREASELQLLTAQYHKNWLTELRKIEVLYIVCNLLCH